MTLTHGDLTLEDIYTYQAPSDTKTAMQVYKQTTKINGEESAYRYTYDANGNIIEVSDGTYTTTYVYDSANQLLRENNEKAGKTWGWTYDEGGNIRTKTEYAYTTGELGEPLDTIQYGYSTSGWGDLLISHDGNTIVSDDSGNMLSYGDSRTFTWKHGRELSGMTDDSGSWTFEYNADGLRVYRSNGTDTYKYYYNGDKLTRMVVNGQNITFGYDASGTPQYVIYSGHRYFYLTNLQGDVTSIITVGGTTVVEYTYDAWGNILTVTGSMADTLGKDNPLRYRGYVYDEETGLYYLQSRYYDPQIGRFINADIYTSTGQDFVGNNMFAYCLNNPANRIDSIGTYSHNHDCGRSDCPHNGSYIPYTASIGGVLGLGIGPLSLSLQIAMVTDSAGVSEIQVSYSAPNIFSSSLPSVDEMLNDITSDNPKLKFGASFASTVAFTNAPSVTNLYGPTYSVGGALPGIAVDYNAIPVGGESNEIYSGVTIASGMITPGFNASMSNTVFGFSVPVSVFDIIDAMYNGIYGG